jgi:hypothetical protein
MITSGGKFERERERERITIRYFGINVKAKCRGKLTWKNGNVNVSIGICRMSQHGTDIGKPKAKSPSQVTAWTESDSQIDRELTVHIQ